MPRVLFVLVALLPITSLGLISFDPITWDAGVDGWATRDDGALGDTTATLTAPGTGGAGGSGGHLNLFFAEPGMPSPVGNAMMITYGAAEDFVAQNVSSVGFQFMGYPVAAQSVYFESNYGGSTSKWLADPFSTGTEGSWESQTMGFSNAGAWDDIDNTGVSFANALTAVTGIGIDVFHSGGASPSAFNFKLDSWQFSGDSLAIPEPGTILMSLTALLGMFGACRRQILDGLRSLHGNAEAG